MQPLCHSAKDLDQAIAAAALNVGKRKVSLLQYLDHVKKNDPSHIKRKSYQKVPKPRITKNDAVAHIAKKLCKKKHPTLIDQ